MFAITQQNRICPPATRMQKHFQTSYSFSKCYNCDEYNFMDMIISSYPAILGGEKQCMFFSGDQSNHCSTYKMKGQCEKHYVGVAQDGIQDIGRPRGFHGNCHPKFIMIMSGLDSCGTWFCHGVTLSLTCSINKKENGVSVLSKL